jgi:hypothetical protein
MYVMTKPKDEYAHASGVKDIERGDLESEGDLVALHKIGALALQLLCCFEVRALSGSLVSSTPE